MSSTLLTVREAACGGALDGRPSAVHTPAVACSVPALPGLVAALLVALRLVAPDFAGFGRSLFLAFGLDSGD